MTALSAPVSKTIAAPAPLRLAMLADAEAIAALQPTWAELATRSYPNIFYEPWLLSATAVLPETAGLMMLAAWDDPVGKPPRLVGLLPLQRRTALRGRVATALQNADSRVRALGEPLILPGRERDFWAAALDFLDRRHGHGPLLRLSALAADTPSTVILRAVLAERGRPCHVTRSFARARLVAGPSASEFIEANVRKKVLKEQRRLRNRLDEQGGLRFDRLAAETDVVPWIDDLFRLELTGWKGREGVAAAADPATEQCFRAILTEAHRLGRLDFHRMRVGAATVALLANIEAGDQAFQLKIAYDETYAAFSPGVLIEMAYLEHALDHRRYAQVDSCARPDHPMIDRIWPDRLPILSLAIPFDRPAARLFCAVQGWLRDLRRRRRAAQLKPGSATVS